MRSRILCYCTQQLMLDRSRSSHWEEELELVCIALSDAKQRISCTPHAKHAPARHHSTLYNTTS
jgi:hypothetical protein